MKFRIKIKERNSNPSVYYVQVKKWYGWVYLQDALGYGKFFTNRYKVAREAIDNYIEEKNTKKHRIRYEYINQE